MEVASYREMCFAHWHLLELGGCQDLALVVELAGSREEVEENSASLGRLRMLASEDND